MPAGPLAKTDELLKWITARPDIFAGKPIIRGLRISVEMIIHLLAQAQNVDAIFKD